MPHVRKADLLNVVRELWGGTGVLEDEAKLVLAEKLISDVWENKKSGIPMNMAGIPIKAALGDRWLASSERSAAGKPAFGQVLAEDPYFVLKDSGGQHPNVKLRISRLAQLIENPQLIQEYRKPAVAGSGSGGGAGSSSSNAGGGRAPAAVTLTDEGLPIRPGQQVCSHYVKHGWCLFKEECWYSHPPDKVKSRRSPTPDSNMFESSLEPGVMLRDGVYPIRPGSKICGFYTKNGWCMFKAKCRHHHPSLQELAAASSNSNRVTASDPQQYAPLVKQPPTQMLLGVLIDSVWQPRSSKEACVKGRLAKHILEQRLAPGDITDETKAYDVHMSQAGDYLNKWWSTQQNLYDPMVKPYKSLAEVLAADPFYRLGRTDKGAPQLTLLLGALISHGGSVAADRLSVLADQVWPPNAGREVWLRGQMAKWLMTAGFRGVSKEGSSVLRQVLSVGAEGADVPTVFRIDMPAAGEYLRRCWETHEHPYDRSSTPYTQLKPLIAGDRFLYIEPAPGKPNVSHVTLDLADMLQHYPITARPGRTAQPSSSGGGASSSAAAAAAANAGASSSRAAAAAGSSSGGGAGDDAMELDDVLEEDDETMFSLLISGQPLTTESYERAMGQQAAAAGSSGGGAGPSSSSSSNRNNAAGAGVLSLEDQVSQAEADIAALTDMVYEPPPEMQWWWPENKAEKPENCWTEVAVRLLEPSSENFELQLAEMVQHLEISSVLAMACATYKSHPHLLQFFAPYAAIGGIEMPAAVYLLDIMKPGPHIREVLELIKPVLSNPTNVKVCHGSHLWSGQLDKAFNIRIVNYFDTQQANYIWHALRHEVGRSPKNMSQAGIKGTAEVSLSSLLRSFGLYHPVRHSEYKKDAPLVWQDRPLNDELITCAAADVTYLLPLMEQQVRNLRLAASEVRQQQQQQRPGSRAAALLSSLPPELTDANTIAMIAQGAEARGGSVSIDRFRDWSASEVFHQAPLHDASMGLHQSYGALRGTGAVRGR